MRTGSQKRININLGLILKKVTLVCFISVVLSITSLAEERALEEQNKTLINAAMEALMEKEFAKAAALFEQVLANEPGDKPTIAVPYAQALVGGSVSMLHTNPKQAEALLQRAIELDPENKEAFFYLGSLYRSKREYAKAIQAYDKAIGLDPYFTDGLFNLGFLYYTTKDYVKAEQMFARAVELRPSYLDETYFNLAVVQNLQGNNLESIRNLEKALEVNPANKRAKRFLLRIKRTTQSEDVSTDK